MAHNGREVRCEPIGDPDCYVVTELYHSKGRGYYVHALVWKIEDRGRKCNMSSMLAAETRALVLAAPRYSAKVLAGLVVPVETLAGVRAAALAAHVPGSLT